MSLGSGIGGIIGAVIGFVVGTIFPGIGNVYGAAMGFVLGFGVGYAIDPMQPDVNQAGVPIQQLQMPDNTVGSVIPDVLGTAKIAGTFLCFGNEKAVPQYQKSGGKGGDEEKVISGYKYYMDWAQGICLGPVDTLYAIYKNNDELLWSGELNRPESGGKEVLAISGYGTITFYFGTDDQTADTTVQALIGDATLNSPLRGLCYAVMKNFYIGEYNRCPAIKFILAKRPEVPVMPGNQSVGDYDYNPAHAMYYILNNMVGLPAEWLDADSFSAAAGTLKGEGRGISLCLDQHQHALAYLESINTHAESIIKYGAAGKFTCKLIRADYDPEELPLIDENIFLEDPAVNRRSWMDTINEIKVQFSEIYGGENLKAYFAGGYDAGGTLDIVDSLSVSDETAAALSAILSSARYGLAGAGSSSKAYFAGGASDIIDALTRSSESIYQLAAKLPISQFGLAGAGSSSKAYFAGGSGYPSNTIQALVFNAETTTTLAAALSAGRVDLAGASSSLKAYFAGGYGGGGVGEIIDALTFSNETCTALAAKLTQSASGLGGAQSSLKAYFAGLGLSGYINALAFEDETVVALSAALSVARGACAGANSGLKAYFAGGYGEVGNSDVIDALQFSDETVAALSAVLSAARHTLAGVGT